MEFSGESIVADYSGQTIAIAERDEELVIANVNLPDARKKRNELPYMSLRRPDIYE